MTNNFKDLKNGDILDLKKLIFEQKFTKPPSRYSQASLIKKLEEIGIGRPSTYATIISTLQERNYVENQKNQMKPTVLGMQVNTLLSDNFTSVTSSELTANLEDNLDLISVGETNYETVIKNYWDDLNKQIDNSSINIENNRRKYKSTQSEEICPTCNSEMEIVIGRFGEFLQCKSEKTHQFALNYREYNKILEESVSQYQHLCKGTKCSECQNELIVRVSKSSLKPYIACKEYRVGNKHTVISIKKAMGEEDNDSGGKKTFKRRFTKKVAKKK